MALVVGFGFRGAGEDLVDISHFGNVTVVVLAPDLFVRVVDVDPIMAKAGCSTMEERCMQSVAMFAHVGEI